MSVNIRLPNLTASDTDGKMLQMQSYMHQLVEQLNFALSAVDNAIQGNTTNVSVTTQNGSNSAEDAVDTFNSIKALIIKSADIVSAYEESMKTSFNGEYIAVSDFGTYLEKTESKVEANSHNITESFERIETITNSNGDGRLDALEKVNGYIKRGFLGKYPSGDLEGQEAFGMAVGETTEYGEYKNYAWFTAKRLSFFDENFQEVAYIGSTKNASSKLYINTAHFLGSVQFGGYKADTTDGLAFVWIGG